MSRPHGALTGIPVGRGEVELRRLVARHLRFDTDLAVYFGDWPKHGSPPRATPDLLFRPEKVAVFDDGCYWHECPHHHPNAHGGRRAAQDARHNAELTARGWLVLRRWEHDDLRTFADEVVAAVRRRRVQPTD